MAGRSFHSLILESASRRVMPIATYPALALTGAKVSDIVTNPRAQLDAQAALRQRYDSPFALSAMDLSAEAEAFGCTVAVSDTEIPTVTGRLITSHAQAECLLVPQPGERRTSVHLEAVRMLRDLLTAPFVLAGCIGPFSLAARLVGVSEAMELTFTDPDLMHTVLNTCTRFLADYVRAFQAAGADAVLMAEPAAGLLSPRMLSSFSSQYVTRIAALAQDDSFEIILHNCAAKLIHLPAILETSLKAFHFGAPMDLPAALAKVPSDVILCGNLDPAQVFVRSAPADVTARTTQLLSATANHRNFVLSSGCDLPPHTPLANLDAFYQAALSDSTSAPVQK